ncbi:MAG: sigma-54 dependent transcriptional regulator [Candidatus Aminicenantes bacterium]|jgi:two-component system nitrogen regulation response regulator NtrX
MIKDKILIIDDEAGIRSSLKGILEDENYTVKTTDSGEKGLDLIRGENFDLVLLDIWLPKMNGIEVLETIKKNEENIQVVMITGHGSVEAAVKATKLGAFDFLEKPLSLAKVTVTVKNALKQKELEEENIQLREKMRAKYLLVGKSPALNKLREEIKIAAPSNGRILIYGENGTGKELIARLIHQQSQRKHNRFIHINSAAIPEDLLENELFGYVKGTFSTGEVEKKGKLFLADGGTLFLDEIGDMSLKIQDKLLNVIKEGKFEPLGSSDVISTDVRVISATNKNLKEHIAKGKFREDLFFKLNVIPLTIPPLRERKEDIPLLIRHFLDYFAAEYAKKPKTMTNKTMEAFINYSWPGNLSELINVIERFVIMIQDSQIKTSHLPLLVERREAQFITGLDEKQSLHQAEEKFEREFIRKALTDHNWDVSKTASSLEIQENELHQKIKNLGISFLG